MTGARFSLRDLRGQCKYLEDAVRSERVVDDDTLAAGRPGARGNPRRDLWGWVKWYGTLRAYLDRTAQRGAPDVAAERMAAAALARKPLVVEGAPGPDGQPRRFAVHPKGYAAHEVIHEHDLVLAWLNGQSYRLHGSSLDQRFDLARQVAVERAYQVALLCWIATHPGAWLPYDPFAAPRPEVPAEYFTLEELEILRIQQAFVHVNVGRGAALQQLVAPPKEDGTPGHRSWAVFHASMGQQLGVPVESLMRDRTVAELIAQAYLAAGAEREAIEAHRRRHEAGAGSVDDAAGDEAAA